MSAGDVHLSIELAERCIGALVAQVDRCHDALEANGQASVYALMLEVDRCHELLAAAGINWIEV